LSSAKRVALRARQDWLPRSPPLAVAKAILDPVFVRSLRPFVIETKEFQMSYDIEQHIEELRAELNDCIDKKERKIIRDELVNARAIKADMDKTTRTFRSELNE
jgi:hypothetical protein